MCLHNAHNKEILKEDIQVWKVMRRDNRRYFSLFKNYEYIRNNKKLPHIKIQRDLARKVHEGYHSFLVREDARNERDDAMYLNDRKYIVVKCIVPKNATIIHGDFYGVTAIVSSTIVFPTL